MCNLVYDSQGLVLLSKRFTIFSNRTWWNVAVPYLTNTLHNACFCLLTNRPINILSTNRPMSCTQAHILGGPSYMFNMSFSYMFSLHVVNAMGRDLGNLEEQPNANVAWENQVCNWTLACHSWWTSLCWSSRWIKCQRMDEKAGILLVCILPPP